jgi:hypothetical protein
MMTSRLEVDARRGFLGHWRAGWLAVDQLVHCPGQR